MELPKGGRLKVRKDDTGHHWVVPQDANGAFGVLDVWWSRVSTLHANRKQGLVETLVLRQVQADENKADVMTLSLGQVYDLIDALTQAVEKP